MGKSNTIDYKKAMRAIRGKVAFDYPLNRRLNSGQKAAITKAYKSLQLIQSLAATPIELKRKRKESPEQYKQRFKREKKKLLSSDLGNDHSKKVINANKHFMLLTHGRDVKPVKINNGIVELHGTINKHYKEIYYPGAINTPEDFIAIIKDAEKRGLKPVEITPANGPYRWNNKSLDLLNYQLDTNGMFDHEYLEDLFNEWIDEIDSDLSKYEQIKAGSATHAYTGNYVISY